MYLQRLPSLISTFISKAGLYNKGRSYLEQRNTAVFLFLFSMDNSSRDNCRNYAIAYCKDHPLFCLLYYLGSFPQLLLPLFLSIKLALLHLSMLQRVLLCRAMSRGCEVSLLTTAPKFMFLSSFLKLHYPSSSFCSFLASKNSFWSHTLWWASCSSFLSFSPLYSLIYWVVLFSLLSSFCITFSLKCTSCLLQRPFTFQLTSNLLSFFRLP